MKTQLRKRLIWAFYISLAVPLVVCSLYFWGAFQRLELIVFDTMTRNLRGDKPAPPEVAVVLIDEASLKAMNPIVGRWPWPRSVYAELIEFISMGNPKAIAFDILFTENERHHERGRLSPGDQWFVDATDTYGNVIHAVQILKDEQDEYNKDLLGRHMPEEFVRRFAIGNVLSAKPTESGSNNFYLPFKELYLSAYGIGVVEFKPDLDGVYRRTMPLRLYKGDLFPVLGFAPVIKALNPGTLEITDRAIIIDSKVVPLDKSGHYLINMYGRFNPYSISGILASMQQIRKGNIEKLIVNPEEFEDKIVFIGASAVGIEDIKPTSVSQMTPGVFLHASFAGNLLHDDFLRPSSAALTVFLVFLLAASASTAIVMFTKLYQRLLVPVALILAYVLFSISAFESNRIYEIVPQITAVVLGFMASFAYLTFTEGKEKRKVRKMLGQYVSPQVLTEVIDRYEDFLKAEVGSRENITVLFSDIRGFTSISENLEPGKVVEMLNQYFSVWSDVIFKYGGTVDKFIGDAIMAFWGAPIKTEDHATKAVKAAIEMVDKLKGLNEELSAKGYKPLKIGIGINTGEAILGNIGSEKKLDYTVIGDTINLASRLESLTKEHNCAILITEYTQRAIDLPSRFVAEVKIRGKEKPVKIYEVTGSG